MAIVTDPDSLSQGTSTAVTDAVWGTPTGNNVTITSSGAGLPSLAAGDFFEVRAHSNASNNGLYIATGSPSSSSLPSTKVTGAAPEAATSEAVTLLGKNTTANDEKSVHFDTDARAVYLIEAGNVSSDGATLQALYSFAKEEWKADSALIPHPFCLTAITPEQFEFLDGWNPEDNGTHSIRTRKVIRTGGWREIDASDVLQREYAGVVTLGNFDDAVNDTAYYQVGADPTDTAAATDFDFSGPVNEAILTYQEITSQTASGGLAFNSSAETITRTTGDWAAEGYVVGGQVTVLGSENSGENDGTYVISDVATTVLTVDNIPVTNATDTSARCAFNYRNAVKLFLRERGTGDNGKTYAQSQLSDIGVSAVDNKVFRFPLASTGDLKIEAADADMSSSPYTAIVVRYFDQTYSRAVDTPGTPRSFGIVIDVGTHSGVDGSTSGTALTTTEGGVPGSTYDGGTLTIHEGTDAGTYTITTASGGTVNITGDTFSGDTNVSFTLQRSSPVAATAEEIYEKVQYLLRQASDVDSTDQVVTGRTADSLLRFVGETLETGTSTPSNPNGGGSGVMIEGFSANDTNRITFYDNSAVPRTFPFVAAGTISFNSYLVSDTGPAEYFMFFTYTERFTNTGFSLSSSSGSTATLGSTTTDLTAELADGDYIRLSGFTADVDNGIWVLTSTPTGSGPWSVDVRKVDGVTVTNESAGASVSLDKNPIDSPDAIVVQDNSSSDITGTIGASTANFDFDYDGNVQGGRTAGTDAAITIRALGLDVAQFVEVTGVIQRAVGQAYSLVAGLERNYMT